MRRSSLLFCLIFLLVTLTLPVCASDQAPPTPAPSIVPVTMQLAMLPPQDAKLPGKIHDPMPEQLLYGVIMVGYALVGFGVMFVFTKLRADPQWSLARALAENTVVEQQDSKDPSKKNLVYVDLPSSSRLIAFLGMIVLLSTFLALGTVMVWTLGRTGQITSMGDAQGFLWAGLSMFAPYLISQGKDAVKAFGCDPAVAPPPPAKAPQAAGTLPPPTPNPVPASAPAAATIPVPGGQVGQVHGG